MLVATRDGSLDAEDFTGDLAIEVPTAYAPELNRFINQSSEVSIKIQEFEDSPDFNFLGKLWRLDESESFIRGSFLKCFFKLTPAPCTPLRETLSRKRSFPQRDSSESHRQTPH
jgi:hypothetical protein